MFKSKMRISVIKLMDEYKSLSFTVGRISKRLRFSKVVVPSQKVTGLEPSGLDSQQMSVAPKLRLKKKKIHEISGEIREVNPIGGKQRKWWSLWCREYKSNK